GTGIPRRRRCVILAGSKFSAGGQTMKIHNPATVHAAPTYSHGIEVPPNARWLYVSGQVGAGRDGKPLEGIAAQTRQVFENIKAILASAGMSVADAVKMTSRLIDETALHASR